MSGECAGIRIRRSGWAPGGNESVGKRKKPSARKGGVHLRTAMAEAARATWRTATGPGARAPPACRCGWSR